MTNSKDPHHRHPMDESAEAFDEAVEESTVSKWCEVVYVEWACHNKVHHLSDRDDGTEHLVRSYEFSF